VAIVDCDFWLVRRKLLSANGGSHRGAVTLRMKPSPCNRSLPLQMVSRTILQTLARAWSKVLTQQERNHWDNVAGALVWHDYLDQARDLRGFHWFVGLNSRRMRAGYPMLTEEEVFWWGNDLATASVELLTSSRIRVTWTPALDRYNHLCVYASGPVSPGVTRVAPTWTYGLESTPRHWFFVGWSALQASSPQEFDLPWVVPDGAELYCLVGGTDYCGLYCRNWLVEKAA